MKRYLVTLLALVLLLVGLAAVASADYTSKEQILWYENGECYVTDTSTGEKIDFTGWREVTLTWQYEEGDTDTWTEWVYSEGNGKLAQGWKQIGGTWYYFWPEMCTGSWYDEEKDTVYLFSENGAWTGVSTSGDGWLKINNKWYYVEKYTETWEDGTYVWKYFYSNGIYEVDETPYFFKDGVMKDDGWNSQTWTSGDGTSYTSWYYANPDGTLATGWKKIGGTWYYFSDWGWMYNDGLYGIDEKHYAFDKSGAMMANKWYESTWEYEGTTYYDWAYAGADGAVKTGWFKVGNTWYYASEWGWIWYDTWFEDGNSMYYLKESGAMAENEWIEDGSAWYWMKDGGAMAANETIAINGKEYKFADNGVWIP